MEAISYTLPPEQDGATVRHILKAALHVSSHAISRLTRTENGIRVNGIHARTVDILHTGDVLEVVLPDPAPVDLLPQNIPLDVVYEDGDVIVVNKPVGMVVHPAPGHPDGTLVNALLYHCGNSLSGINGALRPGIVHRIDRDTSGLIIAAKNDAAHLALAEQLQDHSLYREYEAVCAGSLREDAGTVDAPIGRHPADRKRMAIDRKNGRRAVTHWVVLGRYPGCTHIQCRLETGRTHQIRVHLASIGHPLLGDGKYGSNALNRGTGFNRQALCSYKLRFAFQTPAEELAYLNGREFSIGDVWFVEEFRKGRIHGKT